MRIRDWKKYGFEFLLIFIAVISAFALNNWNENRKEKKAEAKILSEMANGLTRDIEDIRQNIAGHKLGIASCKFWRNVLEQTPVNIDSITIYYHHLTRDYISVQNTSGYETLKSKGLELVDSDSLRYKIISLYEYEYSILKKLEEEYNELQFHRNYFKDFNSSLSSNFIFDEKGEISAIKVPLDVTREEKKKLMTYLWKIESNRNFVLVYYSVIEKKITDLLNDIHRHLNG